jgi:hypothetical protein
VLLLGLSQSTSANPSPFPAYQYHAHHYIPSIYHCILLTLQSMTISLGPIGKVLTDIPPNPRADGYGANPRCLRRDVNKYSSAQTHDNYTYALITKSGGDISKFQKDMLGIPEQNDWGVHMAGHYTIGGDPGGVSSHFPSHLIPPRSLSLPSIL